MEEQLSKVTGQSEGRPRTRFLKREDIKLFINLLICITVPFFIFWGIEILTRGMEGSITYMKTYPKTALLNYMVLLITTSPALLFKRTHMVALVLNIPWVVASCASYILVKVRSVPFIWADLYCFGDGMSIADQYITKRMVIKLVILLVVGLIVLFTCYKVSFKKYPITRMKRILAMVLVLGIGLLGRGVLMKSGGMERNPWDTMEAYKRNGFVWSFSDSFLATFRKKPEGYSQKAMNEIKKNLEELPKAEDKRMPNMIFVQIEGVIDPLTIPNVKFSGDPIPNIRKYLTENYSGKLQVPTIGGGTARTEFEVLSGVNMNYLAPGEIPYTSGLTSLGPVETIAYVLKEKGYATTGIHNYAGNFYSRDTVYKNLGFDRYITMETMYPIERQNGWPKDEVLVEYIKRTLEKTEEKDFIFAITASTHGAHQYNYDPEKNDTVIKVTGDYSEEALNQLQIYVDRVHRADEVFAQLVEYVNSLEEDTIVVMYPDHYPTLDVLKTIPAEERYQTFYYIIDNQNKIEPSQNNDIEAYELYTHVFNLVGMQGGIMSDFQSYYSKREDYQEKLQKVQYDMLFGKKYITDKEAILTPTIIQIGLEQVQIDNVQYEGTDAIITGKNFTTSSRIFMNGRKVETEFVSDTKLIAHYVKEPPEEVVVKQVARYDKAIATSEVYKK
ncbi:hypothetical protein CS063_10435 [Sporanaerobium hydrogeniformans]|uniref:Uncharacterized protein n=1 Tax=Sporanaerobium hydrogeniformans TaxID=3072179 RepID=A0AC61DBT7_9FIRM|nr:LTA synthase family protein [Sporanaerobium hydrogeniformans]PHV70497.1 hypothetical protein CS063_10435 [Sporanaerobium hydrogeniformans]